jgi:hypothetical protein
VAFAARSYNAPMRYRLRTLLIVLAYAYFVAIVFLVAHF